MAEGDIVGFRLDMDGDGTLEAFVNEESVGVIARDLKGKDLRVAIGFEGNTFGAGDYEYFPGAITPPLDDWRMRSKMAAVRTVLADDYSPEAALAVPSALEGDAFEADRTPLWFKRDVPTVLSQDDQNVFGFAIGKVRGETARCGWLRMLLLLLLRQGAAGPRC